MEGASERARNRLAFVQTTLAPENYQVLPPNIHNVTTISKEVSILGNFTVINDTTSTAPNVPTSSGVIAWHCTRDASSIHRFGKVPANAAVILGTQFNNLSTVVNFTYDTWVQYQAIDDVQVSPDLGQNFTFVRPFAGMMEVYSSTISTTNASLGGILSAATLQDSRDVWQTGPGTGGSLTPTTIAQSCVTKKDGLLNVPIYDGIVTVQGSDIPVDFRIPDCGSIRRSDGPMAQFQLPNFTFPSTGNQSVSASTVSVFISPLGVNVVSVNSNPTTNFSSPYLGVYGSSDVELVFDVPSPGAQPITYDIICADLYCSALASGSLAGGVSMQWMNFETKQASGIGGNNQINCSMRHQCGPPWYSGWGSGAHTPASTCTPPSATYLGTLFYATASNTGTAAAVPGGITNPVAYVRANGLYQPGELGPVRIIRWDNATVGQSINVGGRLLVECVPQAGLAPYVTPGQLTDNMTMSVNLFPFLSLLYNGKSPFKRNWVRSQYRRWVESVVPKMSPESLLSWNELPHEVVEAAHAAGLFEGLGSLLGNVAGGLLGQPHLGSMLGGSIGKIGDRFTGQSAGVYGEAAGAYGISNMGTLGSASGDYSRHQLLKRARSDMGA